MERNPVESSNLKSIGYDPDEEILEIEFKGGSLYQYFKIPLSVYLDLLAAPSKGHFLNVAIKEAYRFKKLE